VSVLAVVALLASVEAVTSASEVRACLPLPDGRVLAATSGGLALYDRDLAVERLWTALDGLPGTDVHALLPAADGGVFVGTAAGVAALRPSGAGWVPAALAAVGDVRALASHDGRLVAGTWGEGVVVLDPSTGVVVARPRPVVPDRTAAARITALAPSGHGVLVGTAGAGLLDWDGTALRAVPSTLPDPYVTALGVSARSVLVGTLAGVVRLQDGAAVSAVEARALRLEGSAWWAGTTGEGLRRLDMPSGYRDPLPGDVVTALGASGETECAGTDDGLYVRRGGGRWSRTASAGPPSNDVTALAWDGARLWTGTFDRGLAALEGGRWAAVSGVDARVNALAVERTPAGARVWIATARGLASVEGGAVFIEVD